MKKIIIAFLFILFFGCNTETEIVRVKIIKIYLSDREANDGKVSQDWKTLVHINNTDSRYILEGAYGYRGDSFNMKLRDGYLSPVLYKTNKVIK